MENRIEIIGRKRLIGKSLEMSFSQDKTAELWQSFMPRRASVSGRVDQSYYSMQTYNKTFDFEQVNPNETFVKWAVVEVETEAQIPGDMSEYIIEGGTYAVFIHKGPASTFMKSMYFIHKVWMPESDYEIDSREHFEILPENYNPMDENATEEIWIPVKRKDVVSG